MKNDTPITPTIQPVATLDPALAIAEIRASTTNQRQSFDPAALDDLTASIRASGVQQPVIVRAWPASRKDKPAAAYELVCGERRLRASLAAGRTTIPALVYAEMSDDYAIRTQILENLQREDLGPMEEAESYAKLRARGLPSSDIAAQLGKPGAYVHQRLKLMDLVKAGRDALAQGKLPLGHALEIAKLAGQGDQKTTLKWTIGWRDVVVPLQSLREYIQREFRLELAKAPFSVKDKDLVPAAGACVDCPKRTSADALLFSDVKQGDSCTDAKCFQAKVQAQIHVRIEELKQAQASVPLLSESWSPSSSAPKGTLGNQKYTEVTKQRSCADALYGVFVDGHRIAQKLRVCVAMGCKVHGGGGSGSGASLKGLADRKKEAARLRRDSEVRLRTAKALVAAVMATAAKAAHEVDVLDLAGYAFQRMDGAQHGRLAKLLGCDREVFGWKKEGVRAKLLAELGPAKAAAFGCLASVAGELTPAHTWGNRQSSSLNALAKRNHVDVAAIAAEVDLEIKAKAAGERPALAAAPAAPKTPAKAAKKGQRAPQPKKLSAEGRKRIAAAMKKRRAAFAKAKAARVGKKAAGRLLDGREWNEFPEAQA